MIIPGKIIFTTLLASLLLFASCARKVEEPPKEPTPPEPFNLLVFSLTKGFRHGSIPKGIEAITKLGQENDFVVTASEDPALFTDAGLRPFAAVVFLSTTGDVLDPEQQAAFERFIQNGGGYLGVHAASDTEYDWPWYGRLVGAYFKGHPQIQKATVKIADVEHPACSGLPRNWERTDEWYNYRENPRGKVHVLATLDESSYQGGDMGDHPIAWCHLYDGGRSFYTGGGHTDESFEDPLFLGHLLGGIQWAAGRKSGASGGTVDAYFDKVILDDFVTDPMELAVAPDGRVIFVERGGIIKIWDPDTHSTSTAGYVPVFNELEDGLLGVTLDPDFESNQWIYIYYAPAGERNVNFLSRLTLEENRVDPQSEIVLLEVETQRDECCHSGGSLAFGPRGNLFLSTGDNTNPFDSSGFSPVDERKGRGPWDAQKSSANPQDLRGKVLRIRPRYDGTYEIPNGNLFPADGSRGRPEIYTMGCRNPFRISIDPETSWLYWGDVGPDAGSENPDRGPAGHDEFNQARGPGNFGWPYFTGNNLGYRDYNFETEESGVAQDPAAPWNDSPLNTGSQDLPPAQPAWIPYTYAAVPEFPALGTGGRCAMAGPSYRYDLMSRSPSISENRLPRYYDNTIFLYEWARNYLLEVKFDRNQEVLVMNRFLPTLTFKRPMDLELGPDGCLYLIEWGTGFGGGNPDSQLVKIEYYPDGNRPPRAAAAASPEAGSPPLAVSFSSEGSESRANPGRLSYEWDFDGDGKVDSTLAHPTRVFKKMGVHTARLTVKDRNGLVAIATTPIVVGNNRPSVTIDWPPAGGFANLGETVEYRILVTDKEDGSVPWEKVIFQPFLGHDTHAHPLKQYRGFAGSFVTLLDDGHGQGTDLFTVIEASYGDQGGNNTRSLTGRHKVVLQPKRKQSEYFKESSDIRVEKTEDDEGGENVVFQKDGAFVSYSPMNFTGIEAVTLRVACDTDDTTLELRLDERNGKKLGEFHVPSTSELFLTEGLHPIRIEFFERGGGAGLIFRMKGGGKAKHIVPESSLVHGDDQSPGLHADYYELGSLGALPDFSALTPYKSDVLPRIEFPSTQEEFATSGRSEDVGVVFTGYLKIPSAGAYTLTLDSDDGSKLYLSDKLIVENDGLHGMVEKSSSWKWIDLTLPISDPGGTHDLFVVFHPKAGEEDAQLKLNWIDFQGQGVASTETKETEPHHDPPEKSTQSGS